MSFRELRQSLIDRLEESNRGDRGWWLITRVHLSAARLQQTASYLYDAGAVEDLELTPQHYRELAFLLGIDTPNPAQTINRHLFLAMETPLRLLEKVNPNRWQQVVLTPVGVRLATEDNLVRIFEELLSEMRFCREPWYTPSRVAEYTEFNVQPYPAILSVMQRNEGYVDLDEFDLFVSRIRNDNEIPAASDAVSVFRTLSEQQKNALRQEVAERIPAGSGRNAHKPYDNWRDMARHTFSLFSLGQRAYRAGNELLLARMLSEEAPTPRVGRAREPSERGENRAPTRRAPARTATVLRIPENDAPDDLLTPPSIPRGNTGTEAEILIGKILGAADWEVVYYNQRRGYGFDLWAKKQEQAFVIEVKSFSGTASSIALTPLEYEAAEHHGDNYLLVIVENAQADAPIIHVIQNPFETVEFVERTIAQFSAARSAWQPVAVGSLPGGYGRS